VCIIQLGAFAAWTGVFLRLLGDITRSAGMDPWFHLAQALTIVGVLVTILAIVNMIAAWLSERWWWSKIWETLIALACVGFVWLAIFGHLWGWSVKY